MKIALCLSGQPRGLPVSLELLKRGLDISTMDVFCHAWFDPATVGHSYDSAQSTQNGNVGVVHPQTQELILNELKPVDCIFEAQREFPFARNFVAPPEANQEKMASIFYSIYTANMLKRKYELKNNFKYDLVIRARYDLFYASKPDIMQYAEIAKTHIVTAEKFQGLRMDPNFGQGWYTMTDIFAMSSSDNMDIFCDTYPHMTFINTQLTIPYGENYLGFRVRVMAAVPIHCAPDFDYEIMHRVMDINHTQSPSPDKI